MRIILVSHGALSKGALQAATMIAGESEEISAIGLAPEDDPEIMTERIEAEIIIHNAEREPILILSDLYFGTPFNATIPLMSKYNIYHVSGMNLAMIIEAIGMTQSGEPIEAIAESCVQNGIEGIKNVNTVFCG